MAPCALLVVLHQFHVMVERIKTKLGAQHVKFVQPDIYAILVLFALILFVRWVNIARQVIILALIVQMEHMGRPWDSLIKEAAHLVLQVDIVLMVLFLEIAVPDTSVNLVKIAQPLQLMLLYTQTILIYCSIYNH